MPFLRLLLAAACTLGNSLPAFAEVTDIDRDVIEPADFNLSNALLEHGVAVSNIPSLSNLGKPSQPECSVACDTLKFLYGDGAVETRNETAYSNFVGSYWSANQAAVRPWCVFKPSQAAQVSVFVLLSRLTQCPFAAKSGGHAAMAGASSAQDGITVSFMNMTGIKLSDDKKIASIEPGNIWGDVYRELTKSDVTVIGGLTVWQLVVATGAVIRVSATTYPDLFWALRGGGNNFGLVVNFNLKTTPLPGGKMWGGRRTYTENNFDKVAEAFHNIVVNSEQDNKAGLWHVWMYAFETKMAVPTLYYSESNGSHAAIFDEFNKIPAYDDATQDHILAEFAAQGMNDTPPGLHEVYYVISTKADLSLQNWAKDLYFKEVMAVANISGIVPALTMQGITIPQLKKMRNNGGNALGLKVDDGPLYIIQMAVMWADEKDSEAVYRFASNLLEKISNEAKQRGLYNDFVYMNYASQYQDVVSSYGKDNKDRLKSISAKYDPNGVFQKLQPGYFKLDRAPITGTKYFSF
ncbi:FAD-dependent monooxygenase yanF [Colletotrichum sp. SAR 10_96]|nr:FAD-dependent monooxygenase yanF [Colletotrichum sp. SAR 10_96]